MKYFFWNINLLLLSLFIVALVAGFNYLIDPYGFYRTVEITGLNQQKEGVRGNIRYVKAIEIALRKPRTILMGSSRTHDGMNPESVVDEKYHPVYNYGLDMARIKEIKYFLQHAIANSEIDFLILGLDYFMFNKHERLNPTFDKDRVNREVSLLDKFGSPLFTMSSLKGSFETIKVSMKQPERKEFLENGFRPGQHVFFGLKNYEKLHEHTNYIFLRPDPKETLYYSKMAVDEEAMRDFEEIIEICLQHSVKLSLYISPAHADLDGEGLVAAGQYEEFENWKRSVTHMSFARNISVVDFSGYNSITTEEVKTPMNNYWDSSHFKENVGDMILRRLTSSAPSREFGVLLTPSTIEEHLRANRVKQIIYRENNISHIRELRKFYEAVGRGEKIEGLGQGLFN
jgi:hypothetical protein